MLQIKNKIEFENKLWVSLIDSSKANSSQEERIKFVTDIASVTYGRLGFKDVNLTPKTIARVHSGNLSRVTQKRLNLYNRLLTESAGKASTPFEFIPIRISKFNKVFTQEYIENVIGIKNEDEAIDWLDNKVKKYSYSVNGTGTYYTNMRCLLNAGIKEEDIPFNTPEEVEGFKVILGKIPKIMFDHLLTHDEIKPRRIAESSRNKKYLNEVEFHYPSEWNGKLKDLAVKEDTKLVSNLKQLVLYEATFKAEDATKELSCRRLMLCAFTGWLQDKNGWLNLIKQREVKHTQKGTALVVQKLKNLLHEEIK